MMDPPPRRSQTNGSGVGGDISAIPDGADSFVVIQRQGSLSQPDAEIGARLIEKAVGLLARPPVEIDAEFGHHFPFKILATSLRKAFSVIKG